VPAMFLKCSHSFLGTLAPSERKRNDPQNNRGMDIGEKCNVVWEDIETQGYGDQKWSDRTRDRSEISDGRRRDLEESSCEGKWMDPAGITSRLVESTWDR